MRLLLIGLFMVMIYQSFSQQDCSGEIAGLIMDMETNKPLPFATVKILNSNNGVVSNEKGSFILTNVCEREVDFEVRFIGYKTAIHHHDFRNNEHVDKGHLIFLAPDENLLESVVVEGDLTEGDLKSISLSSIDKSQLLTKTNQSLASAISDIQGVTFASAGSNIQIPIIHGLYGNRILIINNGVKHGFQNWGTDHSPEIDITNADNISVLKGASGVRYGPEALGGVVIVNGNPLQLSKNEYGNISTGYQSNGRGYHINGNLGAGYSKFSYHVGGKYALVGDRHAPDYSLTNTGMKEHSANIGLRYHLPQWDFNMYYSYVDQELGILRASISNSPDSLSSAFSAERPDDIYIQEFSYDINEPKQKTTHHLAKLEADWYSDLGKFTFLISQQFNFRQEFDVRRNSDLPIIDLQLNTFDNRLEWNHPAFNELSGIIGIQYFTQNNDNNPGTNTTAFIPNYNTERFSAYIIENLNRGKNTYEFGFRIDHEYNSARGREQNQNIFRNKFSFTNFTVSLGVLSELSESLKFRSNIGSAWRSPNMAELYSFGQHGFQAQYGLWRYYFDEEGDFKTNRILTEEDGTSESEKGYKWINEITYKNNKSRFILTGYAQYIENFIYIRPIEVIGTVRGPRPAFIYDQADAMFAGTDITYYRALTQSIKAKLGTSYLWSINVEENESLINQPPLNINAEISWKTPSYLGLNFSKLTLNTSYTFEQFQAPPTIYPEQIISGEVEITPESEIFDFKEAPEGYFLMNLLYEYQIGHFGGQMEVRNLLNKSYRDYLNQMRYFADEPGRNFIFSINYKF